MRLQDVPAIAVIFLIIAIILGIGATILTEIQDTQTDDGIAHNITGEGLTALETFGDWQNILAIVAISAVVIGIVVFFFRGRGMA